MRRARLLILIVFAISLHAQTAPAPNVVPISKEAHHHLVLENEYVRVYSVEVPPHSETLYHQHDLDYIFVTLGDSDVENVRVGEKPVRLQLKDGEVRFTKGGFAHKAINNGDRPFRNVTVELKKGAELRNQFLDPIRKQRTIIADSRTNCTVFTLGVPKSTGAWMPKTPLLIVATGVVDYLEGDQQKPQTAVVMQAGDVAFSERGGPHWVMSQGFSGPTDVLVCNFDLELGKR